ncbi:MAG: response regulator, partial [Polyangiaceae bacterium]
MAGPVPAREEEAARLTGARGDFVSSLGRRVEALRVSLRAVEQNPSDSALRNGLLRRVHALSSASRVLGFASVAEALTEAEKRLRKSEFADVARSLDLLPSLLMGVPVSLRPPPDVRADRASTTWPLSVLIFGAQALADAISAIPGTHVECERTEDLTRAREQAQLFGPDLAIIDADRPGARELVETFARDPQVEPVPLVVIGDFANPDAASSFIALGAARVLSKPVSAEALQRTVIELRAVAAEPRVAREPLGELSVEALADRIAAEVRRGLLEAVEPSARGTSVGFGDGADVMAAVWGAVARVRELVTLRSSGAVRFDSSGPEGAVPLAAWGNDERRAGERGTGATEARSGDGVSLQGRRIVVADDDPAVVWFMSGLLKALGVEVLEAHDGARALALTYDTWPDMVVSDVLMPKLDGFSLCHEIKRDVAVRDVPVILLSWKEDLLQRVRELGGSADGYLRKEAAASTVAERLREVLRPRARVEQRIAAGGDARGRLDGLTPRLILELAAGENSDVRVGFRDAVYLYEVQIRRGRLCSATRSSPDGSFERGDFVLAALLGVSAGRFTVERDGTSCRTDFEGTAAQILKAPIDRARHALNSISAGALVGVTRVHVARPTIEGYLACTPEPARALLEKIIAGASPRELITSGDVAPRLLEAVLSDVARRGAISKIEREGSEPSPPRGSGPPVALPVPEPASPAVAEVAAPVPPPTFQAQPAPVVAAKVSLTPSPRAAAPDVSAEDAGWFSLQVDSSAAPAAVEPVPAPVPVLAPAPAPVRAPTPAEPKSSALPFSSEVTPSVDRLWEKITEGVFSAPGTLQGVGLPAVAPAPSQPPSAAPAAPALPEPVMSAPSSAAPAVALPAAPPSVPRPHRPSSPDELDALANALTEESPSPSPVLAAEAPNTTQVMATVSPPVTEPVEPPPPLTAAEPAPEAAPVAASASLPVSQKEPRNSVAPSRVSALKTSLPPPVPPVAAEAGSG